MNPLNLPEVTDSQIVDAFKYLLATDGETTSLDVKNALRNGGNWCTQAQVSKAIWEYTDAENACNPTYDYRIDNGHRVYFNYVAPAASTTSSTQGQGTSLTYTAPKRTARVGDWMVWAPGCPNSRWDNVTRNKARYEYAKQMGVPYVDVKATVF